jgi:hypothetical protein
MMLRRILYDVEDEADGLFGKGRHQVIIPVLLTVNTMQPETTLSRDEPACRFVDPKGGETEATQALHSRLSGEIDEVFLVHVHRGHQCKRAK